MKSYFFICGECKEITRIEISGSISPKGICNNGECDIFVFKAENITYEEAANRPMNSLIKLRCEIKETTHEC